jgi:hypothetical protein
MNEKTFTTQPVAAPFRILATLISYLFHPIFLVPLMAAYLIYGTPSLYLGMDPHLKSQRLITVILNDVFFPLLSILLMKGLGFIKSIKLKDQKDRIIPYVATLTFYFWAWMAMRSFNDTPSVMTAMLFGAFLSVSIALVLNSFLKISMHAIGVGGLLMFMLLMGFEGAEGVGLPLTLSILITGLVFTARMMVSDHTDRELSLGFIVGLLCQLAGFAFFAF